MSNWQFGYNEGAMKVTYEFDSIYCPDVAEHFFQFMKGTGFIEQNVIEAFENVVEELRSLDQYKDDEISSFSA